MPIDNPPYQMSPAFIGESESLDGGALVVKPKEQVASGDNLSSAQNEMLYNGRDGLLHDAFMVWGLIRHYMTKTLETIIVIFPKGMLPKGMTTGEENGDGDN